MTLILASGSPRRKQLIEQMGITDVRVISSDVDESVGEHLLPHEVVERLSLRKANAVVHHAGAGDIVLAADTIVVLEDNILGKPQDDLDAFRMLVALSGGRHQVYTGFTLIQDGQVTTGHEMTTVTFRTLTDEDISAYIATGEPMDKAGGYGIQGKGALLVSSIDGDYYNVMGLPICKLGMLLKDLGLQVL